MLNKAEFLSRLEAALLGLPREDAEERLAFYSEMIDDRVEEGLSEEEAVEEIGPADAIAQQAPADFPPGDPAPEKTKGRKMKGREKALLALGSPLWIPLLAAAAAVLLALYAVLWALVICLWAAEAALWACTAGGIALAVINAARGQALPALALLGTGLACAGLSVFLFPVCGAAVKQLLRLTAKAGKWLRSRFI